MTAVNSSHRISAHCVKKCEPQPLTPASKALFLTTIEQKGSQMRWSAVVLAFSLGACGHEIGSDSPLDTEQADALGNYASPLVFSLIDDTTGTTVDANIGDGND